MLKVVDGERKMGRWMGVCLWLLLPVMVSCQTVENRGVEASVPPEAFTAENWYQVENPNPKQIVRIHGRVPETLDIIITADYGVSNSEDDRCWRPARHFGSELLWSRDRLNIHRNGEQFEAEVVLDKYLPGPCGWRYEGSNTGVTRKGHPDDLGMTGRALVDTSRYAVDDSVPRCTPGRSGPICSDEEIWIASNYSHVPLEVPCRITEIENGKALFRCQSGRPYRYKMSHLLKPDTQEIEVNYYDLDNELERTPKDLIDQGRLY